MSLEIKDGMRASDQISNFGGQHLKLTSTGNISPMGTSLMGSNNHTQDTGLKKISSMQIRGDQTNQHNQL